MHRALEVERCLMYADVLNIQNQGYVQSSINNNKYSLNVTFNVKQSTWINLNVTSKMGVNGKFEKRKLGKQLY